MVPRTGLQGVGGPQRETGEGCEWVRRSCFGREADPVRLGWSCCLSILPSSGKPSRPRNLAAVKQRRGQVCFLAYMYLASS